MLKQGGGAIVNTSSGAGVNGIKGSRVQRCEARHGGPHQGGGPRLRAENIRVNAVCPGYIETPMMGRFSGGTPEGRERVIAEEPVGKDGQARGDRSGRRLAVFGRGCVHDRARHGRRRWTNGVVGQGGSRRHLLGCCAQTYRPVSAM